MSYLHLKLDGARWVFRRRVPAALVSRLGKREMVRTIGPATVADARAEARRLGVLTDRVFAMARDGGDRERLAALAREWFRLDAEARGPVFIHQPQQDMTASAPLPAMDATMAAELETAAALAEEVLCRAGVAVADPRAPGVPEVIERAVRAARRAVAEEAAAPPAVEAAYPPATVPTVQHAPIAPTDSPRLIELIEDHKDGMAGTWTAQTTAQNEATFRLLAERLGSRLVVTIGRREISDFLGDLRKLPARWGQDRRYRGKTFAEMLDMAGREREGVERLSQKTINRHASAISGMFRWAKKHGRWDGPSPAEGFINKRGAETGPKRRPWRIDELKKLLSTPIWVGCRSEGRRHEAGAVVVRDAKFWIPLIGLFSGARLEEIAKLRAADVRQTAGTWVFDITANEAGRVKEAASNRTVPIHSELVALGLIDHAEAIRKAGGGALWPELSRGGLDGKFSHNLTKWFTRYLDEMGIRAEGLSFHSFRHSVGSALHAAGVSESTAADILGHEHKSMSFRVYSEGAAVKPLAEAVEKIRYDGLDLSKLRPVKHV